jgi:hypothetical protein
MVDGQVERRTDLAGTGDDHAPAADGEESGQAFSHPIIGIDDQDTERAVVPWTGWRHGPIVGRPPRMR